MKFFSIAIVFATFNLAYGSEMLGTFECLNNAGTSKKIEISINGNIDLFDDLERANYDGKDEFGWWSGIRNTTAGRRSGSKDTRRKYEQITEETSSRSLKTVKISTALKDLSPEFEIEVVEFELTHRNRARLTVTPLPWESQAEPVHYDCIKYPGNTLH